MPTPYFPRIAGANPLWVLAFKDFEAVLYDQLPPTGTIITYNYVYAIYKAGANAPFYCIASETSPSVPTGFAVLGLFDGGEHRNLGETTQTANLEMFSKACLILSRKICNLSSNETIREVEFETPFIRAMLRTQSDIEREFDINTMQFSLLASSYDAMFSAFGGSRNWNDDLDDDARKDGTLKEAEIQVAKLRLSQAVLNRVAVRLAFAKSRGEDLFPPGPNLGTNKPWWKLW